MSEQYVGINYAGLGSTTNMDKETGIRYGVIAQNSCHPDALEDIFQHGEDLAFSEAKDEMIKSLKDSIQLWYDEVAPFEDDAHEGTLRENLKKRLIKTALESTHSYTAERMAGDIADDWGMGDDAEDAKGAVDDAVSNHFGDSYESDGGFNDYLYEKDGLKLTGCLQTDLFVLKSPYYTYAQFCSPCVPGACNLDHPLDPDSGADKCYCLPFDWFEDMKAPYRIWRVEDNKEIVVAEVKEICPNCSGSGRDTVSRLVLARQSHRDVVISEITSGTIKVQDFQLNPDGESTFRCWRCGGAGHTIEKQEVEKSG